MFTQNLPIHQSENLVKFRVRAVYVPTPEGGLKLARVQKFSTPVFADEGWEAENAQKRQKSGREADETSEVNPESLERAVRRAKKEAFDLILCNHDLDTFCTLTYAPDSVADKASYEDCYDILRVWLSNRVQRRNMRYVLVPERHKSGAVHFHMLCNRGAVRLERARSAKSGRPLSNKGRPVFNITDWPYGFSTAELIDNAAADREAVSKYIFKYMGKQAGAKVGGRHFLHGGDMERPRIVLTDDETEVLPVGGAGAYKRTAHPVPGVTYEEWCFI